MIARLHAWKSLWGFAGAGLVSALVACATPEPEPQQELTPEALGRALAADRELAAGLRRALEAPVLTLETLRRALPGEPQGEETRALGFGASRVTFELRGNRTIADIVLVSAPPSTSGATPIARIRVSHFAIEPAEWKRIAPELERAWRDSTVQVALQGVSEHPSGRPNLRVERESSEVLADLSRRRAEALGDAPASPTPPELAAAWRTLTDPLEELVVGTGCGFVGLPPPGFLSTRALVEAGRFDLLRAVLRGPNPEARVFAAHALGARAALDATDAAAIATLAALPLELRTCEGCLFGASDWNGAVGVLGS